MAENRRCVMCGLCASRDAYCNKCKLVSDLGLLRERQKLSRTDTSVVNDLVPFVLRRLWSRHGSTNMNKEMILAQLARQTHRCAVSGIQMNAVTVGQDHPRCMVVMRRNNTMRRKGGRELAQNELVMTSHLMYVLNVHFGRFPYSHLLDVVRCWSKKLDHSGPEEPEGPVAIDGNGCPDEVCTVLKISKIPGFRHPYFHRVRIIIHHCKYGTLGAGDRLWQYPTPHRCPRTGVLLTSMVGDPTCVDVMPDDARTTVCRMYQVLYDTYGKSAMPVVENIIRAWSARWDNVPALSPHTAMDSEATQRNWLYAMERYALSQTKRTTQNIAGAKDGSDSVYKLMCTRNTLF